MKRLLLILSLLVLIVPIMAQDGASWTGTFYDNPYLVDDPVMTVRSGEVAYNWGTLAPGEGIPDHAFSARFVTDYDFPAGTYRFYLLANDRAAVAVDFQTYLNTIDEDEGKPKEILAADIEVSGVTHIQLDFQKLGDDAYVYLDWERVSDNMLGPRFSVPGITDQGEVEGERIPVNNRPWTAEYFTNPDLKGDPLITRTEASPSKNWGTRSPITDMSPDDFSVRWTSKQTFDGNLYEFTIKADDGVRVFVDGILHIDEWHGSKDEVYTSNVFRLFPGDHEVVVEFYEDWGDAFLDYTLNKVIPTKVIPNTFGTVTITTARLNVRDLPTAINSIILTKINQDEVYPVLGRNAQGTWWLIDVNGIRGWISAAYADAQGTRDVPIMIAEVSVPTPTPVVTSFVLTTSTNLNIHALPSVSSAVLGQIAQGHSAQIVARNLSGTWFKIRYSNTVGWVSARFTVIPADIDYGNIPIADQ